MSQEWPFRLPEKLTIFSQNTADCLDDEPEDMLSDEDFFQLDDVRDGDISVNGDIEDLEADVPLCDCFNCHVILSRCEIDEPSKPCDDLFADLTNLCEEDQNGESTNWKEYFDLLLASYPSCSQEEEDFSIAFYDENDFDPAIYLNAIWS
ncbi:unnamed protein product [Rotaria sp. Silwood2]|nr:unnamed protein product [Rotaria sp. Silwood2]CAF2975962.1 unnamed protein product [Rotaria sp. Silwood2]CAF3367628.1 unnamed protein product [Rotaria sp. Silwood2]CAF4003115.1 unnamed protein product [Rotaria sp. Silwood2]CAF4066222.1 unnamed protein product [Rotaria sp. Silwood2]